jgi:hypothetical protein
MWCRGVASTLPPNMVISPHGEYHECVAILDGKYNWANVQVIGGLYLNPSVTQSIEAENQPKVNNLLIFNYVKFKTVPVIKNTDHLIRPCRGGEADGKVYGLERVKFVLIGDDQKFHPRAQDAHLMLPACFADDAHRASTSS